METALSDIFFTGYNEVEEGQKKNPRTLLERFLPTCLEHEHFMNY